VLAALCFCGCSRRAGLNFECRWVPDPAVHVDVHDPSDIQHLLGDIGTAEELAIRYGDRLAGYRQIETFGIVSRHGGIKDRDKGRRARQQCLATLFEAIAARHELAAADIERARPRLADRGLDLPLTIPVAVLLILAVQGSIRWIRHRFEADELAGWTIATLFASGLVPAVVVAIGAPWGMLLEIIRLGNEHVGERARLAGLRMHVLVALSVGIAAIWIGSGITLLQTRRAAASRDEQGSGMHG
jgi:hypothetical protein